MDLQTPQAIAAYVAIAVPVTVAITNLSKLALEWLNQTHAVRKEVVQQTHEITTQYLNRALDPAVPLAIRQQLLRFLATPDERGGRLSNWARSELNRVEVVVEEVDRAVAEAEKKLIDAQSSTEVSAAEKQLAIATTKRESLLGPPKLTAANLRAGLIMASNLAGLIMVDQDLRGVELDFRNLKNANLSGSDLSGGSFQGSNLSGADLRRANLKNVSFHSTDLRGAKFESANLPEVRFRRARLEGVNFEGTKPAGANFDRATYDSTTKWPAGFDPVKHGALKVEDS
jgi:uncharacterized protein YjbI with pentapeptide repeats